MEEKKKYKFKRDHLLYGLIAILSIFSIYQTVDLKFSTMENTIIIQYEFNFNTTSVDIKENIWYNHFTLTGNPFLNDFYISHTMSRVPLIHGFLIHWSKWTETSKK